MWASGELKDGDEEAETAKQDLHDDAAIFGLAIAAGPRVQQLQPFYLWPENEAAWNFFMHCSTQWRHGFEGPTGLAWEGVQLRIERLVRRPRQRRLWELLEAMERGALDGWRAVRLRSK